MSDPVTVTLPVGEFRRLHMLDLAERKRTRDRARRKAHPVQTSVAAVLRMLDKMGKNQTVPLPADYEQIITAAKEAQAACVDRLMNESYWSWAEVGFNLGISQQAAQQRFGKRRSVKPGRAVGGQPAALR
jgi:hypothetical protein